MRNYWIFLFEIKIMFHSPDIYIFVFLWNPQISKYVTSSKVLLHNGSYTSSYFFWILSHIRMKFGQPLMCCMANISNMILAQCWRLEISPGPFYDFIKMTIQQDLTVFDSWRLLFLIVPYLPFQKNEHWNLDIIGYWVIGGC